MGNQLLTIFILWMTLAIAVGFVANKKGHSFGAYFFLAVLISPLIAGFIVLGIPVKRAEDLLRDQFDLEAGSRVPCPFCSERILPSALICPFCRESVQERLLEVRQKELDAQNKRLIAERMEQEAEEEAARIERRRLLAERDARYRSIIAFWKSKVGIGIILAGILAFTIAISIPVISNAQKEAKLQARIELLRGEYDNLQSIEKLSTVCQKIQNVSQAGIRKDSAIVWRQNSLVKKTFVAHKFWEECVLTTIPKIARSSFVLNTLGRFTKTNGYYQASFYSYSGSWIATLTIDKGRHFVLTKNAQMLEVLIEEMRSGNY